MVARSSTARLGEYDPNAEMMQSYYGSGGGGGNQDLFYELLDWYYGGDNGNGGGSGGSADGGGSGNGSGAAAREPYDVGAVYRVTSTAPAPRGIPWWILILLGVAAVSAIANN